MSKTIIGGCLLLGFGVQFAFADSVQVPATGAAAAVCLFTAAPTERSTNNMDLTSSSISESAVSILSMIDANNAQLQQAAITIRYKARCNYPHTLSISSTKDGMTSDVAQPSAGPDFLKRVNYTATVAWSNSSAELTTLGTQPGRTTTVNNVNPASGNFTVDIDINDENNDFTKPVVAGHYTDKITILIGTGM